jgi:hypothetical protein
VLLSYLELTFRGAVWAVFVAAAAGKAHRGAFRGFAFSLTSVRWLPAGLAAPAAAAVIALEGAAAIALAVPRTATIGYGLAIGGLAAFTATAANSLRRGDRLRCRCFGADAGPIGRSQILRNCALIAIALAGLGARLGGAPGWPGPVAATAAVASGLAIAVAVIRWADLAYLFGPTSHRRFT